jgi:hypothetical protein
MIIKRRSKLENKKEISIYDNENKSFEFDEDFVD